MYFTARENENERGASDQFGVRQMHSTICGGVLFDCVGSIGDRNNGLVVTE
jgi:hypothetical protein